MKPTPQSTHSTPCQIVTIEAWNSPEGWTWNQSFVVKVKDDIDDTTLYSNRRLLAYLRTFVLASGSKGKVKVDRSAESIIEIQRRSDSEPIVAVLPL